MATIKSCKLKNFLCFDFLELDLSSRITCITGASGAGKTAIEEAILFTLFNASPRSVLPRKGPSSLVKSGEKTMSAELVIDTETNGVIIVRRIRDSKSTRLEIKTLTEELSFTNLTRGEQKLRDLLNFPFPLTAKFLPLVFFSHQSLKSGLVSELEKVWLEAIYKSLKELLKSYMADAESAEQEKARLVYQLRGMISKLEEQYESVKSLKPKEELQKIHSELQEVNQELQRFEGQLNERSTAYTELRKQIISTQQQISAAQKLLALDRCPVCTQAIPRTLKESQLKIIEDLTASLKDSETRGDSLEEEIKSLRQALDKLRQKQVSLSADLAVSARTLKGFEELDAEIKEKQVILRAYEEDLKRASAEKTGLLEVRDALGDAYLDLLKKIYDSYIIALMTKWSPRLFSSPIKLTTQKTTNQIALKVTLQDKTERDYELFSTGEKIRLQLLLKLAVSKFLADFSASPILVFDEIIDSLDLENAKSVLELLLEEFPAQVILTSHRPDLAASSDEIKVLKLEDRRIVSSAVSEHQEFEL